MRKTVTISRVKKRRDWFRIIRDLSKYGRLSMADIARVCGLDKTTVEHWSTGGDPRDSDARMVLTLYAIFCPSQYDLLMRETAVGDHELLGHVERSPCTCASCELFQRVDADAPNCDQRTRLRLAFCAAFTPGMYEQALAEVRSAGRLGARGAFSVQGLLAESKRLRLAQPAEC